MECLLEEMRIKLTIVVPREKWNLPVDWPGIP
jgi:hypothetical protein